MRTSVALLVPLLLASASALQAQGTIIPRPCLPQRPCPRPVPFNALERTASHVRVTLLDRVLRYEVEERFINRGGALAEADYVFPLPADAAFEDLKLSIDGELVSGETMNADRARGIYEEIVRRQRDPALVEWMGHGMLRARIFPIAPGEEKRVVVRFQSVAPREGDALRVDYRRGRDTRPGTRPVPLPRPMPVDDDVPGGDGPERRSADLGERESFLLTIPSMAVYGTPYSPTHQLSRRARDGVVTVEARGSTRDVTVLIPVRGASEPAISLLASSDGRDDRFALITLTPPTRTGAGTPRDVTFVVDVSGSMSGRKLVQAKAAGHQLLATLSPRDRFRIVDFSTDVRVFREEFIPATRENVRAADEYISDLKAQGSTNISGALDEALSPVTGDDRLPLVLMLTDGEPTVGETNPIAIAERAASRRGRARVFTFGVGADVNAALVERLALEGRGTAAFVRPTEDVERTVALTASRLTDPVVTDLRVRADGVRLERMHPAGPADLFAGEDLIVLARYEGSGAATLRFTGRTTSGRVEWTQRVTFPERERGNRFVPRLWATQRVGWLSAEKRRGGGSREIDDEIRSLGERYAIPTEFTSYLVLEPGMQVAQGRGVIGFGQGGSQLQSNVQIAPAAPAPVAEQRFEAARAASKQRGATSLAAADMAVAIGTSAGAGARSVPQRRVGDRLFHFVDSTWTDLRHDASRERVKVRPYSDAWFALAREMPGLADVFALGDRVIVSGKRVEIEVTDGGTATLSAAEIASLRARW